MGSAYPPSRTTVALATALLVLSALCASGGRVIEGFFGAPQSTTPEPVSNPLYRSMARVAKRHGVSLAHARTLVPGKRFDVRESRLFSLPDHSLDVLIVGDSTAKWGFSPRVVSEVSGLKVGAFGYAMARPTSRLLDTVRVLADKYLNDRGLVLLSFTANGWSRKQYADQIDARLQELTSMRADALTRFLRAQQVEPSVFSQADLAAHWKAVDRAVARIPLFGPASLPDLGAYGRWLEPVVAPRIAAAARENEELTGEQIFYFWDEWKSVIMHCPRCPLSTPRSKPLAPIKANRHMLAAARKARAIPRELGFVIPYYGEAKRSARLRGLYRDGFKGHAALVDLEEMWPLSLEVRAQGGTHVTDEGPLYQSILLGRWLERHRKGDENPNRRTEL